MTMIQVVCITVQWNKSFQKVKMQPWNVDYELTCQHQVHNYFSTLIKSAF